MLSTSNSFSLFGLPMLQLSLFFASITSGQASTISSLGACYDTLHIARGASNEEIKRAYIHQALKWHPDKNNAPDARERFLQVHKCYETLLGSSNLPTDEVTDWYNQYRDEARYRQYRQYADEVLKSSERSKSPERWAEIAKKAAHIAAAASAKVGKPNDDLGWLGVEDTFAAAGKAQPATEGGEDSYSPRKERMARAESPDRRIPIPLSPTTSFRIRTPPKVQTAETTTDQNTKTFPFRFNSGQFKSVDTPRNRIFSGAAAPAKQQSSGQAKDSDEQGSRSTSKFWSGGNNFLAKLGLWPSGEDICEGHNFDQNQCMERELCCSWTGDACASAIERRPCRYYDVKRQQENQGGPRRWLECFLSPLLRPQSAFACRR